MSSAMISSTAFAAIVKKVKRLLMQGPASVNGIRSLSRSLNVADDCGGSGVVVSKATLASALAENGVTLMDQDLTCIITQFDRDGTGDIDPTDFLAALRGDVSQLRRVWLQRVWEGFLKDGTGCVSVDTLQQAYHSERHPDVAAGTRTVAEVAEEFASTFNATTNPDGVITNQEFEQYYAGVSGAYCDDESFISLLRGVWGICSGAAADALSTTSAPAAMSNGFSVLQTVSEKAAITAARNQQAELQRVVTREHRQQIMSQPFPALVARLISRSLRRADVDTRTFLSSDVFLHALREHRLYFANPDVLSALDTCGDGTVDYLYYLELLLPPLPAGRRMMLERLWRSVFPRKDEQGRIDVKELVRGFAASSAEERDAFLNSWDVRLAVQGRVSLPELIEWYAPQSVSVNFDKDFDSLLARHWPAYAK